MTESSEHIAAADVLESSEFAERLVRRLTSPPGVINTRGVLLAHARLTEWSTRAHPLLHDLLMRYSMNDGSSFGSLPFVTDPQGLLNINSYLTHNQSVSSTTNNFFSSATNEFTPSKALSSHSTALVHSSSKSASSDAKSNLAREASESLRNETFRVSRNPGRRSRLSVPANGENALPKPTLKLAESLISSKPAYVEDEAGAPATARELKALALGKIQQPPERTNADTSRPVASYTDETRDDAKLAQSKFAAADAPGTSFPALELIQAKQPKSREHVVNDQSVEQPLIAKDNASVSIPLPSVPLVQSKNPASQFQSRPTQLVWRKSADTLSMRDLLSDISSSGPLAAVRQALDALPVAQSRPTIQTVTPESQSREEKRPNGEELASEGMLRRLSTMLLIERERRGY